MVAHSKVALIKSVTCTTIILSTIIKILRAGTTKTWKEVELNGLESGLKRWINLWISRSGQT